MANNRSDEEDIIRLHSFLNGDDGAFSFIYNKYVDELFAYGTGLGFEREVLKDAIQDIFVKFYMSKTQLKGVVHLKYYLFRMLKNRLLDTYKFDVRRNSLEMSSELPFLIEPSVLDELIAGEEKADLELRVGELLQVLTDRQKEAVYLHFIQELAYEEVANLLDMTAPAVRKLISRAIKRMRNENI
ncbi:MAG: sigma-70 family RNA polymerase sigma factor [Tannerella sp.]|jgi:RNA polymerase sigma factor (sigma-70 family)|nr:sigma-70 family RNA polymerase sigma factor [Tannerella sp.]